MKLPSSYSVECSHITKIDDSVAEHERYTLYYKGINMENSDIRVHYYNNSKVFINGEYFNVTDIDTSLIDVNQTTKVINLQNITSGQYNVQIISSDEVLDNKTLIVQ